MEGKRCRHRSEHLNRLLLQHLPIPPASSLHKKATRTIVSPSASCLVRLHSLTYPPPFRPSYSESMLDNKVRYKTQTCREQEAAQLHNERAHDGVSVVNRSGTGSRFSACRHRPWEGRRGGGGSLFASMWHFPMYTKVKRRGKTTRNRSRTQQLQGPFPAALGFNTLALGDCRRTTSHMHSLHVPPLHPSALLCCL